jgi:uncharacterized protein
MVTARRSFEGTLPIAGMTRLCELLAGTQGAVNYTLEFGRDDLGVDYLDLHADATLTMTCMRTMESFQLPVSVRTRLGLLRLERDEAGLPPDCEPLLVPENGRLKPADVIEDELLLALPLVPVNPDSSLPDGVTGHEPEDIPAGEGRAENPFAVLSGLKK